MSKVLKGNVILGGREFKAGTKAGDLPADVKEAALQFLVDEKKFKADQQDEVELNPATSARISDLESLLSKETDRADNNEKALSQANSDIAGLTSQLEDVGNSEELQVKITELETALEESGAKVVELEKQLKDAKKVTKP